MKKDRRGFLAATAALAASELSRNSSAAAQPPITQKEVDQLIQEAFKSGHYTCVRTPEANDGPFYYESSLRRRDIAEGRPGSKLKLMVTVANASNPGDACAPLSGAVVDVWHADADGMYSNVGHDVQNVESRGKTFMRGHQVTDADGRIEFNTVVPGWELVKAPPPLNVVVRTTHIHLKVFHEHKVTTVQLYFPDDFLDLLYASTDPYRTHRQMTAPGLNRMVDRIRNGEDPLFGGEHPMPVEKQGDVIVARATIGLVTMGTTPGARTLFR
jgi:protocatechuate 3,4-dioxygenase beta subunit